MEINKSSDIVGVVTAEDIVEGRMVLLTTPLGYPADLTGRLNDRPGVKTPDTLAEAARATFVITWPVDNREVPIVYWPTYPFSLRQGFDRAANAPITGRTIYLTYPGYQNAVTIPSGHLALGFTCCGGVFTLTSGQFVYNVTMQVPGTRLRAANTATDGAAVAGMLTVMVSGASAVAEVEYFDVTNFTLTFRCL